MIKETGGGSISQISARRPPLISLLVGLVTISLPWTVLAQLSDQERTPRISQDIRIGQTQVDHAELSVGNVAYFNIEVQGSSPLVYSWLRDGVFVTNTTSAFWVTQRVQESDGGTYRCIVSNSYGSVRSRPFELVVKDKGVWPTNSPDQMVQVEQGKFVLLKMPAISYKDDVNIDWKLDGQDVPKNGLTTYVSLDHNLVLLNVPASYDNHRYKVRLMHIGRDEIIATESNAFVLDVTASTSQSTFKEPEFVISPHDKEVVVGSEVKMECVISGQPFNNLQISWYKGDDSNRTPITGSDSRLLLGSYKRVLTIKQVTTDDGGIYGCEGKITGQTPTVKHQATLTVLVPPTISNRPAQLMIEDFQETVDLHCGANGVPVPDLHWYFNGKLMADQSAADRYKIHPNSTLSIPSVDLPDSGVYQCFANSSAGEAYTYTELFVNSAKPTVTQAPVDKTVAEEEDTGFKCIVSGGPRPDIVWTKDGQSLSVGNRIRITQQELLISSAEMSDSGVYTCRAVNIKGSVSVQAKLTVVVKTKILKPPMDTDGILSNDARMECGVRSDPTVVVTWKWYFTGQYATQATEIMPVKGNREILPDGTLLLYSLIGTDSGVYECVVTSAGGDDRKTATLNVIELPAPPLITSVTLNPDLSNSVRIDWEQSYDGHTPILKFIIQSRLESFFLPDPDPPATGSTPETSWEPIDSNVDPDLRSIIVKGLQPSKYYRFRMMAVNKVNESLPSDPAPKDAIKMPAQPPSEPPKNLYCQQGGERQIIVRWEPPPTSSWNGDLQGYYVYYKVASFGDERKVDVKGADTRQTTIGFLAYNMKYRVSVAAYNEKGAGVRSGFFYVKTRQGKPAAPPQNVELSSPNSTTIKVMWDPPDQRVLNGENKGYDIDVRQGTTSILTSAPFDDTNPTGRQTYYLMDLSKFTKYNISITCKTAEGQGPWSLEKEIRTLEDRPGAVSKLRIVSTTEQNMFFTWEPPLEPNGEITGYLIEYQKRDGSSSLKSTERGPAARSHSLLDLAYNTAYVLSVQAKTQVGLGPAVTTEFNSAEPPQKPSPPTQLQVTQISDPRSVLLQFRPGFDGKASILLWIIEAQIEDSTDWVEVFSINDPMADEILVKNLRPYTYYRLRVIAQNVFAKSDPSEPAKRVLTKQAVPDAAPTEVTPRAASPTEIVVRWRQIERSQWNGDFLGYKILYRRWSTDFDLNTTSPEDLAKVRENKWTTVTLRNGSNIQGHTLWGLEEWMRYEVVMKAYNGVGDGPASQVDDERTLEGVPSASPVKIEPQAFAPTSIKVTWGPLPILEQNGYIKGYKVKYKARDSGNDAEFKQVEGADVMETALTDLRMFVEYDIQVLAYSRIGDGVLSPPVTIRTLAGAPGPPVHIWFPEVSDSAVTIVWEPPDEPNGIIRMYQVAWRRADEPDTAMKLNSVDKPKTPPLMHQITALQGETTYIFSVKASTQDDWGVEAFVEVITVADRDRPDPPSNIRIGTSEIKARSMEIYWAVGEINYGPIRNFTVQFRKRGSTDWATVEERIGPGITSFVVTDLKPNSFYSFRVAATNDEGMSDFSQASTQRKTLEDEPDGAPQNVQIVALTRTSIKISWEPPPESTWNGNLVQDVMMYREEGAQEYRETVVDFGIFTATLQRLEKGVLYEIRIASENAVGVGPPSVLQVFRVGDIAPFEAPQDFRVTNKSSTELNVSWSDPPGGSTNGELIGYTIMHWKPNGDVCDADDISQRKAVTVKDNQKSLVLGQLTPHTMYCSTVKAFNIAGEGPPTSPKGIRTSEDLPGAPGVPTFKNITLQELVVQWEPPAKPNGVIVTYELKFFALIDNQQWRTTTQTIPGADHQLYVSGLIENQLYTFQLAALTSVGQGNMSESTVITGPQPGSPEAPSQPIVEQRNSYLILTWDNGDQGDSPINGYRVRYKEDSKRRKRQISDSWTLIQEINNPEPRAQINLKELKLSTDYVFRVWAINSQGISEPSPPSASIITPQSLVAKKTKVFHTQWWFLVIVALAGVIFILLLITLLCYVEKRRNKGNEMKRSATTTTVMSTPEPEDGGFPSLELRQSRINLQRNGKTHSSIYSRSPPRPSPASVTYFENLPPPMPGASAGASSIKPPLSEDNSSVMSEKPSHLGNSSDDTTDSDSDDSIAKAPVPASPPPPAFSSHFSRAGTSNSSSHHYHSNHSSFAPPLPPHTNHNNRSTRSSRSTRSAAFNAAAGLHSNSSSSNPTPTADLGDGSGAVGGGAMGGGAMGGGAMGGGAMGGGARSSSPSAWRFNKPNNAYTYTDSEAESSHYAFSLNNGNIVVNNVAGARTPLAGFSSFV